MDFPTTRMRRYRKNAKIREVMRETKLNIEDLIYPLYAAEDIKDGELRKSRQCLDSSDIP